MKKIEYLGLFVCMLLVSGFCITLYPRRVAVATEETITKVAKEYAHLKLFKIMMQLNDAEKAITDGEKKV